MKKEKPPRCLNCKTELKPVKDLNPKLRGHYLWRCPKCDPKHKVVISIG